MFLRYSKNLHLLVLSFLIAAPLRAQGPPPTLVVTEPISMMEFNDQITLVGRTEALRSGNMVAEVSGRVIAVNALEGVSISKGSPLVTIDTKRLRLSLDSKNAEAAYAEVETALAKTLVKRAEELYAKQLISESSIDSARVYEVSKEQTFQKLKAERDQLALDVARSSIRTPYAGYTGRQLVNIGEWVSPGTEVFELIDPSKMKVIVDLPERYFGHLVIGSEALITLSSDPDNLIIARVSGISPNASQTSHTFPVVITVDNADGRLGGGMLVRATLSLNERFESLAVTKDAIIRNGNQTTIYTVVDGKASLISVTTTSTSGVMIAVSGDGLSEGMPVVIRGNERIFPGAPVRQAGDTK